MSAAKLITLTNVPIIVLDVPDPSNSANIVPGIVGTNLLAGRNIDSTIDLAASLFKQAQTRVGTGPLNQALQDAVAAHSPPSKRGRPAKFLDATQISAEPPTLVIFVNDPKRVIVDYERYLMNQFHERLPFEEVPIRLIFRGRRGRNPAP